MVSCRRRLCCCRRVSGRPRDRHIVPARRRPRAARARRQPLQRRVARRAGVAARPRRACRLQVGFPLRQNRPYLGHARPTDAKFCPQSTRLGPAPHEALTSPHSARNRSACMVGSVRGATSGWCLSEVDRGSGSSPNSGQRVVRTSLPKSSPETRIRTKICAARATFVNMAPPSVRIRGSSSDSGANFPAISIVGVWAAPRRPPLDLRRAPERDDRRVVPKCPEHIGRKCPDCGQLGSNSTCVACPSGGGTIITPERDVSSAASRLPVRHPVDAKSLRFPDAVRPLDWCEFCCVCRESSGVFVQASACVRHDMHTTARRHCLFALERGPACQEKGCVGLAHAGVLPRKRFLKSPDGPRVTRGRSW